MNDPTREEIENIAAMRADGSLHDYLQHLAGRRITPKPPTLTAVPAPAYRITHAGGWPLGTAASGPLAPSVDRCTCAKCGGNPASRVEHRPQEGTAA
jgi:hypothetical protein